MEDRKEGPVDKPGMANGAQVALEDFNIPQFPREARGLMALTLISQIKADDYHEALRRSFEVTHLPPSIQSLTLELFALGYPPGFLKALIAELPELRSLVIYGQQFSGLSDESSDDAVAFIKGATKLRDLHFLDAFISGDFVQGIADAVKQLEKPLMFIEINYTNRSKDQSIMSRIPAADLPSLVHQGMISCSLSISPQEPSKKQAPTGSDQLAIDGIQVLDPKYSNELVERLLQDNTAPKVLKHLNITLYPITVQQLKKLLVIHKGLMVLNVSIAMKDGTVPKKDLFETLAIAGNLEQAEIVLCPPSITVDLDIAADEQGLRALAEACKKLTSLKVNQLRRLRTRSYLDCEHINGKWNIVLRKPELGSNQIDERPRSKKSKVVRSCGFHYQNNC